MNQHDSPSGTLIPTIGGVSAFVPHPLPPKLDLTDVIGTLSTALLLLGELNGIGRTLVNPYLLIRPLQRQEAVASSLIEGTQTSLSDLFLLEAGADERDRPPDTREVLNYVLALDYSIGQLEELPVCLRMIRSAHGILLKNLGTHRGGNVQAGEFRRDQNWIGGRTIDDARFVPPPVTHLLPALDDWEKFIQNPRPNTIPPLVHLALIHYQFEAIHPFSDGNGRVGRLLLPVILCDWKVMDQPLLYLSPYFEREKDQYIDRLFNVSANGDWIGWIEFFLSGVIRTAQDAISTVQRLQDLNARYRSEIQQVRAPALAARLVDLIFEEPYLTIPRAQKLLDVSYMTAKNNIDRLVSAGMLREVDGPARPKFFVAREVFEILDRSPRPENSDQLDK